MNTPAYALLVAAIVLAAVDWAAVATSRRLLEYATKVGVMVALIGFAVVIHPASETQRWFFAVALTLGLVSDVFLMLPRDLFLAGLVAALVEHLAYIAGFRARELVVVWLAIALLIALVSVAVFLPPIHRALRARRPALVAPVYAYVAVFVVMVASAGGTGSLVALAGALLFFYSDAILAWNRFVRPIRYGRVVNLVPYHLGQVLLVLSLVS
jgi:uncharacterized membrane protein YhhN